MTERPTELTVAEYSALRAEILQAQQARMVVLGLVVTLLSAVSTLALSRTGDTAAQTVLVPGAIAFSLLIIAIAVHFTAVLTRHMDTLGGYIRVYIEGGYDGEMWETVWTRYRREAGRDRRVHGRLPLGQSKVYALIYAALVGGLLVVYLIAEQDGSLLRRLLVAAPAASALALTADLYLRRGSRWATPFHAPERANDP